MALHSLVDLPECLQWYSVLSQLPRDKDIDKVVEANRAVSVNRRIIALKYRLSTFVGSTASKPFPNARNSQLNKLRGFSEGVNAVTQ
jgi:hypothetical protein